MFDDLLTLLGGWYADYVEAIRDLLEYSVESVTAFELSDGSVYTDYVTNTINPSIWSAYVPWEHIIASVTLIVFTVCIFKFMRTVLCKIL